MLSGAAIIATAALYLGVLFAIAWYADRRADRGRSIIANPWVYALSIAVYCTAWTFYGSVGRAASTGLGFLPIYLGPTLMAALWWLVLRKMVRVAKAQRITSIADFIASRYGKSQLLAGLVTVIAVVGIMPYISLQLKAISTSYQVLGGYPDLRVPAAASNVPMLEDSALYAALLLAAFTIVFGTRHIDLTERHEGMVAAIACESLVKLAAFLAVGGFVAFGLYDGPADIFARAAESPQLAELLSLEAIPGGYTSWLTLTLLAMLASMFLPRQFQVAVVENVNEEHIRTAAWLFPLYLLVINLFVLPIALGGALLFSQRGAAIDPDTYVLTIPMLMQHEWLAMLVFIGGLSAATGMVIVATITLATMVSNDLLMPLLLRGNISRLGDRQLGPLILAIRRWTILAVLLLGYLYYHLIGESFALVTTGLVSFAAAAQFAPPILVGLYWRGASRAGAIAGLLGGFAVWSYTLLLPGFAQSGWLAESFVSEGPFGIALLKPYALFGLEGFDRVSHAVFWSLLSNIGLLVGVSLFSQRGAMERVQAALFCDPQRAGQSGLGLRGDASVAELRALAVRFLGERRSDRALAGYAARHGLAVEDLHADPALIQFTEQLLAGAIGTASAHVMVTSVVRGEALSIEGVMEILDETSQVLEYSRRLESKSRQLQAATADLRAANERLKELDRLKDEFVSTVSHELRTPLTSIRSFSEILLDNPDLDAGQRSEFLRIVVKESERLTRLINDVLDLAKIESGGMDWRIEEHDLGALLGDAAAAVGQLYRERGIDLRLDLPARPLPAWVDADRIIQLLINLLSNAAKFCDEQRGEVSLSLKRRGDGIQIAVTDNGPGIPAELREKIFAKFQQVANQQHGKPQGSGLGLTICRAIVEHHGGGIGVQAPSNGGARFVVELPLQPPPEFSGPQPAD